MQWQGKSTNFSTNQIRQIGHSNISWNSENWICEYQQNHVRTYSINSKSLQCNITEDNLKKLKTKIKKSIEEKYKSVIEKLTTKMNDEEKCIVDISTQTEVSNWLQYFQLQNLD